MATLGKIRSKGPLLVVVIGLGLFAFLAGDAWKVIAPHQTQDAGEVAGKTISAQEFQTMFEEYSDAVKFTQGINALTDEQNDQIKDQVWNSFINNQLVSKEAKKLGIVVTDAEMQDIINEGTYPLLANTPFRNQQTGAFDKDMLNMFLVNYSKMNASNTSSEMVNYYQQLYKYWTFLEKTIRQNRLAEKYQSLIAKSLLSNPIEAKQNFENRVNQSDILYAAIPYASINDTTVVVKNADLQEAYNKNKEQYRKFVETRNIRYIDVQVVASDADKAALQKEMDEYTAQLKGNVEDYTTFVRSTGSEQPFVDLYYTSNALPADVVSRLDSVNVGEVFGPYYNSIDNTMNSFKKLAVVSAPDSIQYRQIQVTAETQEKAKVLADSIYKAIKSGSNFADLAKKYGQTGEPTWITSANYEGAQVDGDNLKYVQAITTLSPNELTNLALSQANVILEVTDRKAIKNKYKIAVVKRIVEFSKDTYNEMYNNFSQFVAANNTFDKMVANAENAGYKLLTADDMMSSEHNIGGIKGTKEALKWAFSAKPGDVSGLYECGESDRMLMVGLSGITKPGYLALDAVKDDLRRELIRDKKAEKIMADMKALNPSSFDGYKGMAKVVSDTVKHVSFAASAYVSQLASSEPNISAYSAVGKVNELSQPIKGISGVFVLQTIANDKLNETFDEQTEKNRLESMYLNLFSRQFISDLYLKANVKDQRYLFF